MTGPKLVEDEESYMSGVPPQMRDLFFEELSRYSAIETAKYFDDGWRPSYASEVNRVVLPRDEDHRKELVHAYLLTQPDYFQEQVRSELDLIASQLEEITDLDDAEMAA